MTNREISRVAHSEDLSVYGRRLQRKQDSLTMNKKLYPLIDPRGVQQRPVITLAPRPALEQLKNGKILFYDNTKLSFCNYGEVFVRIKERLREIGVSNFVDYRETVRGKDTRGLENYAAMLAQEKPVAAVVALGDMGTSPATCIVTIALEKLGIPTVYITAPPGGDLVEGVAVYRAGNLCLCKIDIYQASTAAEVREQIDLKWEYIIGSLTAAPERLKELAHIDFKMDLVPPAADGLLPVTGSIEVEESRLLEPGCYMEEIMDYLDREHIGDGLPVIPPTKGRLEKMYAYCPFDPEMVLWREVGPTGKDVNVRDVAIAAVMAGCRPEAMPILVTAFKALADPKYNLLQSVTTSHPGGNLVLVSGPIAQEVGISGKQGCLGPGYPANATIGRAVNLVILNVSRAADGSLRPRLHRVPGGVHVLFCRRTVAGAVADDQ